MNASIRRRLMAGSAVMALLLGNMLHPLLALAGGVPLSQIAGAALPLNLVYLWPAALAAAGAAWVIARDPDFDRTAALYAGAAMVLLTFVGYFLLMALWLPLSKYIGMSSPAMVTAPSVTLFLTLLLAVVAGLPGWALQCQVIRWARGEFRRAGRTMHEQGRA